jgi:hypothetical protein
MQGYRGASFGQNILTTRGRIADRNYMPQKACKKDIARPAQTLWQQARQKTECFSSSGAFADSVWWKKETFRLLSAIQPQTLFQTGCKNSQSKLADSV